LPSAPIMQVEGDETKLARTEKNNAVSQGRASGKRSTDVVVSDYPIHAAKRGRAATRAFLQSRTLGLTQMQPRQAFFEINVPRRHKRGGLVECTDMKMRFR